MELTRPHQTLLAFTAHSRPENRKKRLDNPKMRIASICCLHYHARTNHEFSMKVRLILM
jgi:hypothetical protein